MSDEESGNGVPLIEPLYPSLSPSDKNSGKRKRDDENDGKKSKKQRKKTFKKKVPKDVNDDELDGKLGLNLAIGRMDGQLLVDHVAQRTKRFEPDLSTVEKEDRYLPGTRNSCTVASSSNKLQQMRFWIPAHGSSQGRSITCPNSYNTSPNQRRN